LGDVSAIVCHALSQGDEAALAAALEAVASAPALPNSRYVQRVAEEVIASCGRLNIEPPAAAFDLLSIATRAPSGSGGYLSFFPVAEGALGSEPLRVWVSELRSDVSTCVWPSALPLIDTAVRVFERSLAGRRVLELGAGTGIVGRALSRLIRPAPRVTITDGCARACDRVRDSPEFASGDVEVNVLDWGWAERELLWAKESADVVIASDVVYDPSSAPALSQILKALLETPELDTLDARTVESTTSLLNAVRENGARFRFALFANERRSEETYGGIIRELEVAGLRYIDITEHVAAIVAEGGGPVLEATRGGQHNVRFALILSEALFR
jgi:SAM-dependent methyltransferase